MYRILLFFLLRTCSNLVGAYREIGAEPPANFVEDIVMTWKLLSPTIIFRDEMINLCRTKDMMLCLINDGNITELAEHLAMIHQGGKQDGLIFVGSLWHDELLSEIVKTTPYIFTSNCPVFMPKKYSTMIKLRLDSNIIFFEKVSKVEYELADVFSVKNGPKITIELGKWGVDTGMRIQTSMNRWYRRTDLIGTTLTNAVTKFLPNADFIRGSSGEILGTKGKIQDQLFYITNCLNLTIETVEAPWDFKKYENGSYGGGIGMLQRKEVDIFTVGLGISLERSMIIDFAIPTSFESLILVGKIPTFTQNIKTVTQNLWTYVGVFGVYEWVIYFSLGFLLVAGFSLKINLLKEDNKNLNFGTKRGSHKNYQLQSISSGMSLFLLYAIQMGSHTNSRHLAQRLLTLTGSMLTFLMFVYFAMDITAEMTSGPTKVSIKNFDDILHNKYKVLAFSTHYKNILANAEDGTARKKVYQNYFGMKKDYDEALQEVIENPRTLLFASGRIKESKLKQKELAQRVMKLNTDNLGYSIGSFGLQKNSEFLQMFNHYILKGYESGFFGFSMTRGFFETYEDFARDNDMRNEQFAIKEPQPLGPNEIMSAFMLLGFAICVSFLIALAEFLKRKYFVKKTSPSAWSATLVTEKKISENEMVLGLSQPSDRVATIGDLPGTTSSGSK